MKRIIYSVLLHFFAVTMMAQSQTSFIVADKNGNSQMVPSLIFQQEQYGDRTSSGVRFMWDADGVARGSIEDVSYIARTNSSLTSGTTDDVTEMLEQISGKIQADAGAVAAMLKKNENVEDASSSADGQSLIVKYKDTDVYSVYPLTLLQDPFDDDTSESSQVRSYASVRKASSQFSTRGSNGKVAVFNYFSNQITRKTQNKMLEYMMYDLNNHGYGVEYYPYEDMTVANVKKVIATSSDYTAVIVMSHGFATDRHSYFAIGEAYDRCNYDADVKLFIEDEASENDKVPFKARFWNEGFGVFGSGARYDCAVNVNKMQLDDNVILYMGSCDAYNKGSNQHGTCVGWSGSNTTAQAHATLLFYNLMRGKTLADAIDVRDEQDEYYYSITKGQPDTWRTDPLTNAQMKYQFQGKFLFSTYLDPPLFAPVTQYYRQGRCFLVSVPSGYNGPFFTSEKNVGIRFYMRDDFGGNVSYPEKIYIKATPLRSDESPKTYSAKLVNVTGTYGEVNVKIPDNGAYVITAASDEAFTKEILLRKPLIFIKAKPFKENSGEGEVFYNTCPDNNHPHAIDLGLPSGTLWACCNVGAKRPEECGGYYAWGDTKEAEKRELHNCFDDYVHCDGDANTCHNLGASICGTEYDVAHVKWGGNWRMPTIEEYNEIREKCSLIWDESDGKDGLQIIGPNNNSIYLPAMGQEFYGVGQYGRYWTGTQYEKYSYAAYMFEFFRIYGYGDDWGLRGDGHNVRPVINTNTK